MRENDGLRSLQVGVAGHDTVLIRLCLRQNGGKQVFEKLNDLAVFISQIQANVKCDLVVSAARRVKAFPRSNGNYRK